MYLELAEQNPAAPEIQEGLGYLALRANQQARAETHFGQAVELGSTNPRLYYDYALALRGRRAKPERVIGLLREAVGPGDSFITAGIG